MVFRIAKVGHLTYRICWFEKKKNAVRFYVQITSLGIEKEKKKTNPEEQRAGAETAPPASLRTGERFFYLQLYPGQIWHSKHLPAMDNTTGFLENSYSPTDCQVTL